MYRLNLFKLCMCTSMWPFDRRCCDDTATVAASRVWYV